MEYGVSVGNEVGSDTLIYLTLASRVGDADITVTQTAGNTYKYADTYTHQIATLGLTTGKAWYLKLELSVNTVNWDGKKDVAGTQKVSDSGSYGGGTFGFGYRW